MISVGNILGEGVLWRPSDQTIWWTDIQGKTLYCLEWGKAHPKQWVLTERLACFGFVAGDDSRIIAGFETGFAFFHLESSSVNWLHQPDELRLGGGRRLNDGRVGPDGAFWVGSMLEQEQVHGGQAKTGLYRLDGSGDLEFVNGGFKISNGLAWSPCGQSIFYSDSSKHVIYRAAFDPQAGKCGQFEVFVETVIGEPDGATIDSKGNYWSALWGAHKVVCFNQEGIEVATLEMSVPQPTIPVFGGPELKHLIVASAKIGLSESELDQYPQSGNLFIYATESKGIGPNYFGSNNETPAL